MMEWWVMHKATSCVPCNLGLKRIENDAMTPYQAKTTKQLFALS